jgi:serine/threonine protein kinase
VTAGFLSELKRRGVLGALIAYGVAAAGLLQLGDIVSHALEAPPWTMRLMVWLAAAGLPITFVVSWFWDLTRHGFVRTQGPRDRPAPATPRPPTPAPAAAAATPATPAGLQPVLLQELRAGAVLAGRYRIDRELGRGGMGRVLAATDARLGRRVAVKVVSGAHEPSRVRRFEQEARTAGALEHPNVLAVYDLGEQDGVPFLVTELLDGHTLRNVLASGPLPSSRVADLALQLARGLGAAHARGVVHRDLKPENLFVTSDGRLKILDFGLAKLAAPSDDPFPGPGLTLSGAIFGTPGYISPEQARGEPAGPASDVFSAGAVLYEMLTGRRAFPGGSLIEAGHAALTREPLPLPPSVPQPLGAAVLRSLQKDPARRFRDGGELAYALESAGGATRQPIGRKPPKTSRRLRRVVLSGLALLFVAAIASRMARRHAISVRTRASEPLRRDVPTSPDLPGPTARDPDVEAKVVPPYPPAPPIPPVPSDRGGRAKRERFPFAPGSDSTQLRQQIAKASRAGEGGLLRGARALERAGQADKAERLLAAFIAGNPGATYARLYRFSLLRRLGRRAEGEKELRAYADEMESSEWPAPLLLLYAGEDDEEEVLSAAKVPGDERETRSRLCEAYFYLGLLRETDSPPDLPEARRSFGKAIAQGTQDIESDFAQEELASLERQVSRRK